MFSLLSWREIRFNLLITATGRYNTHDPAISFQKKKIIPKNPSKHFFTMCFFHYFDGRKYFTLMRPISRESPLFHAHCFQFLWSASLPLGPNSPLTPRGPGAPATPFSPLTPSLPSRPGNPFCPFTPLRPGRPGDPCRHKLGFCVTLDREESRRQWKLQSVIN